MHSHILRLECHGWRNQQPPTKQLQEEVAIYIGRGGANNTNGSFPSVFSFFLSQENPRLVFQPHLDKWPPESSPPEPGRFGGEDI